MPFSRFGNNFRRSSDLRGLHEDPVSFHMYESAPVLPIETLHDDADRMAKRDKKVGVTKSFPATPQRFIIGREVVTDETGQHVIPDDTVVVRPKINDQSAVEQDHGQHIADIHHIGPVPPGGPYSPNHPCIPSA